MDLFVGGVDGTKAILGAAPPRLQRQSVQTRLGCIGCNHGLAPAARAGGCGSSAQLPESDGDYRRPAPLAL